MQNIIDQILPYLTPSEQAVYLRLWKLIHAEEQPRCAIRYEDLVHCAHVSVSTLKRVLKKLAHRGLVQVEWQSKCAEDLVNQASCLNLVTNAIIVWNTVYIAQAVEQLKREGYPVNESDLAHIWPTRYEHINVYDRYHFNLEEARRRVGL